MIARNQSLREVSGLPVLLDNLLGRYRLRANATPIVSLVCAVVLSAMAGAQQREFGKVIWPLIIMALACFVVGLRKYLTRARMLSYLEEAAVQYGKVDEVLRQVEHDLSGAVISGSYGVITQNWVLTSVLEPDLILFALEPIEEIDIDPRPIFSRSTPSKMWITFRSGRVAMFSQSEREMCEIFARLKHRFGVIPTTDRAWEVLITYHT